MARSLGKKLDGEKLLNGHFRIGNKLNSDETGKSAAQRVLRITLIVMTFVGVAYGGYFFWDQVTRVSTAELEQIVQRDGVPFELESIPNEMVDRLASNRVVIIGEFHFLREHRQLIAQLLPELHARGFRQYLFEWTQAADWLLADFVNDGGLMPEWKPPHDIGRGAITAIRDFNRTLPEGERIQVHAIDVTVDYGGGRTFLGSLTLLASHLPEPGPLAAFLQGDYDTYEQQKAKIEVLQDELISGKVDLIAVWGEQWYETVAEMVEVETASLPIRAVRESDYHESVRMREAAIKWLADRRIAATPNGTLLNIGNTHGQKEGLWGTEGIEWLGDYLAHRSPATGGPVMALSVAAASIVPVPGTGDPDFDLSASPKNELLRVMNGVWPDQAVFLALDDHRFSDGRVPFNFVGEIYVGPPQLQYDAYVLLPVAHRDFVGD